MLREGERLRSSGSKRADAAPLVDVRRLTSTLGHVRVAVVVPKYGFTAVRRNKLKRRLRELTRRELLPLSCACDLVIRARREAYVASFDALRSEVERLAAALV